MQTPIRQRLTSRGEVRVHCSSPYELHAWENGEHMFTLEIAGQPIAVTDAGEDRAEDFFASDLFRSHLRELQSDGRPLWDGASVLTVRPASEAEIAAFRTAEAHSDPDEDEASEEAEAFSVVYLVEAEDEDW